MTPPRLHFAELSSKTMSALLAGDLDAVARTESGVELGELFVDDQATWLWDYRLKQLKTQPEAADWGAQLLAAVIRFQRTVVHLEPSLTRDRFPALVSCRASYGRR